MAGPGGRATEEHWNKRFEVLNEILIFAPSDLAELGTYQPYIGSDDPDSNRLLGQLWGAAKEASGAEDLADRPRPSSFALQGWDAYQLANAISADSAKDCELGRASSPHASALGLPLEGCDATGPREKIRRLAEGATSAGQISQFSQAGTQMYLLRNCDASLRSAAAGIRCWG